MPLQRLRFVFGWENGEPPLGVFLGHELAIVLHEHLDRGAEIECGLRRISGGGQPIGRAGMAKAILGVLRLAAFQRGRIMMERLMGDEYSMNPEREYIMYRKLLTACAASGEEGDLFATLETDVRKDVEEFFNSKSSG